MLAGRHACSPLQALYPSFVNHPHWSQCSIHPNHAETSEALNALAYESFPSSLNELTFCLRIRTWVIGCSSLEACQPSLWNCTLSWLHSFLAMVPGAKDWSGIIPHCFLSIMPGGSHGRVALCIVRTHRKISESDWTSETSDPCFSCPTSPYASRCLGSSFSFHPVCTQVSAQRQIAGMAFSELPSSYGKRGCFYSMVMYILVYLPVKHDLYIILITWPLVYGSRKPARVFGGYSWLVRPVKTELIAEGTSLSDTICCNVGKTTINHPQSPKIGSIKHSQHGWFVIACLTLRFKFAV